MIHLQPMSPFVHVAEVFRESSLDNHIHQSKKWMYGKHEGSLKSKNKRNKKIEKNQNRKKISTERGCILFVMSMWVKNMFLSDCIGIP